MCLCCFVVMIINLFVFFYINLTIRYPEISIFNYLFFQIYFFFVFYQLSFALFLYSSLSSFKFLLLFYFVRVLIPLFFYFFFRLKTKYCAFCVFFLFHLIFRIQKSCSKYFELITFLIRFHGDINFLNFLFCLLVWFAADF